MNYVLGLAALIWAVDALAPYVHVRKSRVK